MPQELRKLFLYKNDAKLCERFSALLQLWSDTYLELGGKAWVLEEIAAAHAWEFENKSTRKKDRPKFLGTWLRRAATNIRKNRKKPENVLPEYVPAKNPHGISWEDYKRLGGRTYRGR